nr:hypothetical protein [Bacteroidota bacterium]
MEKKLLNTKNAHAIPLGIKGILLSIATMLIFGSTILSQPPQSFKYQALVRDNSGEILQNQSVGIRISIHDATAGGTILYQETFTETTNQFGMVNLEIGNGTPTLGTTMSAIDWGNNHKFLEVEVDPQGGTSYVSMGTSQLLSVPFALYSDRSKDAPWENCDEGIYYNLANVGIGIETPLFKLDVRNPTAGGYVDVGVHTDDAGGAISAYSSTLPAPLEHFAGRLSLWSNAFTATGLDLRADGISSDIRLYTGGFGVINERMRITPEGKVGVGTGDPEVNLDVVGEIRAYHPGATTGEIYLSGPLASPGIVMYSNEPDHFRANIIRTETGLGFGVHGASSSPGYGSLFIANSGYIGVGSIEPETRLQINNTTQFNPDLTLYG